MKTLNFVLVTVAFAAVFQLGLPFLRTQILHNIDTIMEYWRMGFDKGYYPDFFLRFGVRFALGDRLKDIEVEKKNNPNFLQPFIDDLKQRPIAEKTEKANEQHYEVDTPFYDLVLGRYKKYSATLYPHDTTLPASSSFSGTKDVGPPTITLDAALSQLDASETAMMDLYIERAGLCIGPDCTASVLDLGCGWGSFTLYYASQCPKCRITSISNSNTQIEYITKQAAAQGSNNVRARVLDVNNLQSLKKEFNEEFDFVVSVEMFEHMKNYEKLMSDIGAILKPSGRLFVHIFVTEEVPYHFVVKDASDFMTKWFFEGGTMPSYNLLPSMVPTNIKFLESWKVNGVHYSYTLETWLSYMDKNEDEVRKALANIYGKDDQIVEAWWNRWRWFFIACSELFAWNDGVNKGEVWYVAHYLFEKV